MKTLISLVIAKHKKQYEWEIIANYKYGQTRFGGYCKTLADALQDSAAHMPTPKDINEKLKVTTAKQL